MVLWLSANCWLGLRLERHLGLQSLPEYNPPSGFPQFRVDCSRAIATVAAFKIEGTTLSDDVSVVILLSRHRKLCEFIAGLLSNGLGEGRSKVAPLSRIGRK